jgi:hypothetical protein
VAAAKRSQKCLGRCGASSEHKTKLEQSIFFRYLCKERQSIYFMSVGPNQIFIFKQLTHTLWLDSPSIIKVMLVMAVVPQIHQQVLGYFLSSIVSCGLIRTLERRKTSHLVYHQPLVTTNVDAYSTISF